MHNSLTINMSGRQLVNSNCIKILGITFDKRYSWIQHINSLKNSISPRLNIIKILSHTSWGSKSHTLIQIYKSLILSKLDYGAFLWSAANKSAIKKLDVIYNAGLRMAIRAYRSSPVPCIHNLAGIPPLNIRRLLLDFLFQCKDPVLSKLFFIGFIIMGSFVTLFNYVGYRLMLSPFSINQTIIGFLSLFYLIGVYSSPQAGILTEKYNKGIVLINSVLLMIIGLLVTQSNQLYLIFFGLMLFAAGFFAAHSVASSWIGHHTIGSKAQKSSLYLFFYYLGSSIFGTCGGIFWFSGGWTSISLFIISMLILGIFLAIRLERIEKI